MGVNDNGAAVADLATMAAEVSSVRDFARAADARATEAIRRVESLRLDHDQDHRDVGDAISETQQQIAACETNLLARVDALEETTAKRHTAVSDHLEKIWGHLVQLDTTHRRQERDLSLLAALVVILGLLLRGPV